LQGTLDMLVLQALRPGPQHGYGIAQAIAASAISIFSLDPANARYTKDALVSYKRRLIDAVKSCQT